MFKNNIFFLYLRE